MSFTMDLGNTLGMLGVALCFASFLMKRMVSLRVLALLSNVCFIAYGVIESLPPSIILNAALLPVNVRRLWEIRQLSRHIAQATYASPVSQWLLPHMTRRRYSAGEVLFHKGAPADKVFYIASGQLTIADTGHRMGAGELLGEIGIFSPTGARTQTVVCETDAELYYMTDEMIFELYYLHPKLGFYLMRLIVTRLIADVHRQQTRPAAA